MLALLVPASAAGEQSQRIIVKRDPGLSPAERQDIRADAGVRLVETLRLPLTEVVAAPAGEAKQALRELNRDPDVVYAELDRRVHAFDDELFGFQWALNNTGQLTPGYGNNFVRGTDDADMDVLEAWADSIGKGELVAVVDTGVLATHPDLDANVAPGYDWVDRDTDPTDLEGHGTHVSGIIAAEDDDDGSVGVAPAARILPLRVLDDTGSGNTSDVAEAFDFAGDQGVRIVNASLGSDEPSAAEHDAIQSHANTLYVVAAGNDTADPDVTPTYPCAYNDLPNIICVGASDADDNRASFSNYGATTVDLFAPGDRIVSTYLADGYAVVGGTSQASPQVAGEAALLLARNPGLDITALKTAILDTGDLKPAFGSTFSVTGRRANAFAALESIDADRDGDTVLDDVPDNCPSVPNLDQEDSNANGVGDACESPNTDSDGDGVLDADDACPYQAGSPDAAGCVGEAANNDADARPDMFDNCPTVTNPTQANLDGDPYGDACDADLDNDGAANGPDNCDTTYNPTQANLDGDALGDACDGDRDGDGKLNGIDGCPDVKALTSTGCPVVAPGPVDSDHDGIYDVSDGCRLEYARTNDGCPVPTVTSLSAKARKRHGKRSATISVRASRAASVQVTIQRRVCRHDHCRWARVTRKTAMTVGGRATVTAKRLKRGRYRAVVVLSSSAGATQAETQRFRVR